MVRVLSALTVLVALAASIHVGVLEPETAPQQTASLVQHEQTAQEAAQTSMADQSKAEAATLARAQSAAAASHAKPSEETTLQGIGPAPTPTKCTVPWPVQGRWTDCIPETTKEIGEECTWEHEFGHECKYEDGPIACNTEGQFERTSKGPQQCTKMKHPVDRMGCARFDLSGAEMCRSVEGCSFNGEKQFCETACRGGTGCGVELHRRDAACYFNCPLRDAHACAAWQAGCTCIQDTLKADCDSWCGMENEETFIWLEAEDSISMVKRTVMETLSVDTSTSLGYDPIQLCRDGCFSRGVCISAPVPLQ